MSTQWYGLMILIMFVITIIMQSTKCEQQNHDVQDLQSIIDFYKDISKSTKRNQLKRQLPPSPSWIFKEFPGHDDTIKMHAFIVRDEEIPPCCTAAKPISDRRHFMCSGAVLTLKHAITSASCMHFADVYEHHINAELAILLGAFTSQPSIIKINSYEMHPNYDYDVASDDVATYDLAILFLNCSFSLATVTVPRLPEGFYDDIGHVCCSKHCELITVTQNSDNHHTARILPAKYLPSPIHTSTIQKKKRVKKSPGKLAGTPLFFSESSPQETSYGIFSNITNYPHDARRKKIRNIFDEITNARKEIFNKNEKRDKLLKIRNKNGRRQYSRHAVAKVNEEMLTMIDWKNIEERLGSKISTDNRKKMEKLAKKLVDVTMQRMNSVVNVHSMSGMSGSMRGGQSYPSDQESEGSNWLKTFMPNATSNGSISIDDYAVALTNIIKSVAATPDNANKLIVSSDLIVDEKNLGPPPSKYIDCPPLGTPIFESGVLIALIAYTCDDVQNWVQWKYVSISNNMNWIRRRISAVDEVAITQHQIPNVCDESLQRQQYIRQNYNYLRPN